MKKLVMTAAVIACAASVVTAQTVTSANIVGYGKVNAVGGQLSLVALNFDTGGLTVNEILGDLPSASVVHLWDKSSGGYISSTKGRAGFSPNPVVNLGDALWILAAGVGTNEIVLSGEVLVDGTNTTTIAAGIDASGYFYPVETLWGDTDLSTQLANGSVLHIWNGASYDSYTKGRAGWGAGATVNIGLTQGFWVESSGLTWSEVRPFSVNP